MRKNLVYRPLRKSTSMNVKDNSCSNILLDAYKICQCESIKIKLLVRVKKHFLLLLDLILKKEKRTAYYVTHNAFQKYKLIYKNKTNSYF